MVKIEWTQSHRREALRRHLEIVAELIGSGNESVALCLAVEPQVDVKTPEGWYRILRGLARFSAKRCNREIRRVDGLATGRLVRETWTVYRVRVDGVVKFDTDKQEEATMAQFEFIRAKAGSSATFSTVTRTTIRRAR